LKGNIFFIGVGSNMMKEKKKKISAIGIFTHNLINIDDHTVEWIDAKEFSLAELGKVIGIDENHNVKAKITLEVVEEPCELCGELTTGDKICANCGKIVCDRCARKDKTGTRYCPICFELKRIT